MNRERISGSGDSLARQSHAHSESFVEPECRTTTIRMALDILRPDSGRVSIFGSRPDLSVLRKVGYLPEEAGLPPKSRVLDTIRYLARLKGLSREEAETRAGELLSRVGRPPPTLLRAPRQEANASGSSTRAPGSPDWGPRAA